MAALLMSSYSDKATLGGYVETLFWLAVFGVVGTFVGTIVVDLKRAWLNRRAERHRLALQKWWAEEQAREGD